MEKHHAGYSYKTYGVRSLQVWWSNTVGLKIISCTVFLRSFFSLNSLAKVSWDALYIFGQHHVLHIKKWRFELSLLPQSSFSISHCTHFSGATPHSTRNEREKIIKRLLSWPRLLLWWVAKGNEINLKRCMWTEDEHHLMSRPMRKQNALKQPSKLAVGLSFFFSFM